MDQILIESADAADLERIYRRVTADGEEKAFQEALVQAFNAHPDNALYAAWIYRLDIHPLPAASKEIGTVSASDPRRHWILAIVTSAFLGICYALFAWGKPPAPIPGETTPMFWIGWAPITALSILFWVAMVHRPTAHHRWYGRAAIAVLSIATITAIIGWNRTDHTAILLTIHLPFFIWAAVGMGVTFGRANPARQFHAFMAKSIETLTTGGIYFGTGGLFLGLTAGIFAALGIHFSEALLNPVAAWGIGAIPILALASLYNPMRPPVEQDRATGLARILGILTRLVLPLALTVLVVYIFWFIPFYFWRPFQEREVLIVYNATIIAIIALLTVVISTGNEAHAPKQDAILRYAVLALVLLTFLLNAYALAAIVSRMTTFGLTPNRHAVLGWNVVTLIMLFVVMLKLFRSHAQNWQVTCRETMACAMILPVAWTFWVLFILPQFH